MIEGRVIVFVILTFVSQLDYFSFIYLHLSESTNMSSQEIYLHLVV